MTATTHLQMNKIAIYDFCSTIVNFETADAFVHYVTSNMDGRKNRIRIIEKTRLFLIKTKILTIFERIYKIFHNNESLNKAIILWELKGVSRETVNEYSMRFYEEMVRPNFISCIIKQMEEQKKQGYYISIVSASYDCIIEHFKNEYEIDEVICNILKYDKNGKFVGKLTEKDCIGKNKVSRFMLNHPEFNKNKLDSSIAYGDSFSDTFLFEIVDTGVVVCKKIPSWYDEHKWEVIIYESL